MIKLCHEYNPRSGILDVTRTCTAECSGCCNPSRYRSLDDIETNGLRPDEYIEKGFAERVIDQIARRGNFISIEGGEPTIDMATLTYIVKYAKSKGMVVEVVTNASRCTDMEKAKEIMGALKEAGTGFLMISAGYEHNFDKDGDMVLNKHPVPSANVTYAINASNEAGMFTEVRLLGRGDGQLYYVNKMPRYIMDRLGGGALHPVGNPAILECKRNGETIRFVSVQTFPVARGADIDRNSMIISDFPIGNCTLNSAMRDGQTIGETDKVRIDYTGKARACCGPGSRLQLKGNLKEESLDTIVKRANKNNRLVRLLTNVEMKRIISLAFEEGLAKPRTYHEYCDFCYHELANPEKTDRYLAMLRKRLWLKV